MDFLRSILSKLGGLIEEGVDYVVGTLRDPDSWVGVAAALAILFFIPAELIKFAALGICIYLIAKPNARKTFLDGK